MERKTIISVIMPAYNAAEYIADAISHIQAQDFHDWELLVVEDGSTDDTAGIVRRIAREDPRVRLLGQQNSGVSRARNRGLAEAKGQWIAFADSDDEVLPGAFSAMLHLATDDVDAVFAGYEYCNNDGLLKNKLPAARTSVIPTEEALELMYRPKDYGYHGFLWTKLFRSSMIRDAALSFDEEIYFNEDRVFCVKFLCAGCRKVAYTTVPVYRYFERPGSAMSSLKERFNPRYVTDLDAYIEMKKLLQGRQYPWQLRLLSRLGVIDSYHSITGLMKQHGYDDPELKRTLRHKMLKEVSPCDRAANAVYTRVAKIKHILSKSKR